MNILARKRRLRRKREIRNNLVILWLRRRRTRSRLVR